jgi:hypothetical protein
MADPEIKDTAVPNAASPAAPDAASAAPAAAAPQAASLPAEPSASPLPANELAPAKPEPGIHDTPTLLETVGDKPAEPKKDDAEPADAKPADGKDAAKAGDTKAADAKAADAAKPDGDKKDAVADAKPAEPVKPEAVAYEYKLPETLKMDDALKGEFHTALDAFRGDPAKGAQPLIDLHNKVLTDQMTAFTKQMETRQRDVFAETNKQWHKEILADPVLGGSGYQTMSAAVARMRDLLVPEEMTRPRKWDDGSPRMSELTEFMRVTGAGNHRVLWHILHNAARYLDEPQAENLPTDLKPPADIGRDPSRRRGAAILYDNPRSKPNGGG